jgi:hypothetical protein
MILSQLVILFIILNILVRGQGAAICYRVSYAS